MKRIYDLEEHIFPNLIKIIIFIYKINILPTHILGWNILGDTYI